MTLTLDIPTDRRRESRDEQERLEKAAVALYDAHLITQGQAAEMAGLSRVEFFDRLGHYGVSPFQYSMEEALADADLLADRK